MAEGDFIRNTFKVTLSDDGRTVIDDKAIVKNHDDGHYGADGEMARDIAAYLRGTGPGLPLDITDALEAGITAMAMDQAMRDCEIVDLTETWARFDAALAGEA
jgi:hypothetical protein